jgi:hypothetical protein
MHPDIQTYRQTHTYTDINYMTLRTLHYIALHGITLHYITITYISEYYAHIYIDRYIDVGTGPNLRPFGRWHSVSSDHVNPW